MELTEALESIQARALRLGFPDLDYTNSATNALQFCETRTLEDRWIDICKKLFTTMQDRSDKLNRILPPKVNTKNTTNSKKYPLPKTYTERYKKSFVPYALYNLK